MMPRSGDSVSNSGASLRINTSEIEFDPVDGEPLCGRCGENLVTTNFGASILIKCPNERCPNHSKELGMASDYSEITGELLLVRSSR